MIKKNSRARDIVIINRELLEDFDQIDQESLLRKVKCPVLIIHGDTGEEEKMLSKISRVGARYLPSGSRIEIIEGADHKFNDHINEVIDMAIKWYGNSF
jgi:pimeloyl-ACP methyl ester carboxylesterase